MSVVPGNTHSSALKSLYLLNTPIINISTIQTSDITVGGGTTFADIRTANTSSIYEVLATTTSGDATEAFIKFDNNLSTAQSFIQGIGTNSSNAVISYSMGTPPTTKGSINFVSTITGSTGGVVLTGEDGTSFSVGDGKSFTQSADLSVSLATQMGISTAVHNFYVGGEYQCGINFDYPSSIVLTASNVYAPNNLYAYNLNASTINVSSINGVAAPNPVVAYINPYGGNIAFSTVAGVTTNVLVKSFSTLAGHNYRVSVEYNSSNAGGGNAEDNCTLAVSNLDNVGAPYGNLTFIDSWTVATSQNEYRTSKTMSYYALANNPNNVSAILVSNNQTGNAQVGNLSQLDVQDMGFAVVNY